MNIVESAQTGWFHVTIAARRPGDDNAAPFGLTVQAKTEEEASNVAVRKFAEKWGQDISTEVTKVEPTDEPVKAAPAAPPRVRKPKPKKIKPLIVNTSRLRDGRAILPTPANGETWVKNGEPSLLFIDQLDLHPDGLSTAYSAFHWNDKGGVETPTSDKPVAVTVVDGRYHVLDGYHRVVKAHRHGKTHIMCQVVV